MLLLLLTAPPAPLVALALVLPVTLEPLFDAAAVVVTTEDVLVTVTALVELAATVLLAVFVFVFVFVAVSVLTVFAELDDVAFDVTVSRGSAS